LGVEGNHLGGNFGVRTDGTGDLEGRLETSSRQVGPETVLPVLLADETLKTGSGGDRASEGLLGEREERRVLGKLEPTAGSEGLEEKNSKRGAARVVVNNCGALNAAWRG